MAPELTTVKDLASGGNRGDPVVSGIRIRDRGDSSRSDFAGHLS